MTAPADQFIDIAKRSQDAFATVTRAWVDSVQALTDNVTPNEARLPDVQAFLDSYFDFVDKLLANQREIAHQWVNAAVRATETVADQAARATRSVTEHTANGTQSVVDSGAGAAKAPTEATASSVRAARGAAR